MANERKGRYIADGVTSKGRVRTKKANLMNMLRAKETPLAFREATIAARETAVAKAEREAQEKGAEEARGRCAKSCAPVRGSRGRIFQAGDELTYKTGALSNVSQSRVILL